MTNVRTRLVPLAALLAAAGLALTGVVPNAGAAAKAPKDFALKGDAKSGARIYKTYCKKCHGKSGDGTGVMAKDLTPKPADFTDKARMGARSDWQVYLGIKKGGLAVGLSPLMTPWKDTLNEQEIHDVAVYIRAFAQ